MSNTGLDQLVLASSFTEAMKEIRQEMKALQEDVNHFKGGDPASQPSRRKLTGRDCLDATEWTIRGNREDPGNHLGGGDGYP